MIAARPVSWLLAACAAVLTCALACVARAQPAPYLSAGGGAGDGPSHGWLVVPSIRGTALVHVPPRAAGVAQPAPDGTMRQARELPADPIAIAASGDRVFLVFEDHPGGLRTPELLVKSLTARPTPVADLWAFEPDDGFRDLPDLPAGEIEGFAAADVPVAIVSGEIYVLHGDAWRSVAPPSPLRSEGWASRARLVSLGDRIGLLAPGGRGLTLWTGVLAYPEPDDGVWKARRPGARRSFQRKPEAGRAETPSGIGVLWSSEPIASDGSLAQHGLRDAWLGVVAGVPTVVGRASDGDLRLVTLTPESSRELGTFSGVAPVFGVTPLDNPGRVVVSWLDTSGTGDDRRVKRPYSVTPDASASKPGETPASREHGHLEVREISVFSGAVLYSGVQRGDSPVSAREVQALAVGLVALMVVVLLLVLTRDPDGGVYHLPEGVSLAEPGRRATAGLIDAWAALFVAARIWNVGVLEMLGPGRIFTGEALSMIGTAVAIGLVLGVLGEWLTGRSVGKLLVGCVVIDVRAGVSIAAAPRLWQALVRNAVKWIAFPAAMLGLMESTGRHRGDAYSRTAVVIGLDEENEPNEPEES